MVVVCRAYARGDLAPLVDAINWPARRRPAPFGHKTPRDECWYHLDGRPYVFGGVTREDGGPWPETLERLREHLSADLGVSFNSVLCNLYRDGRDSVAWHSDDEPELGHCPVIASLSLGAERMFKVRRKGDHSDQLGWNLRGGDLVVMRHDQREWEHCVPKTRRAVGPRLNLTFRIPVEPARFTPTHKPARFTPTFEKGDLMARTTDNPRTAIVNMRVPPADKAAWQRAAARVGMTLTDWLCARANRAAKRQG